MGKTWAPTAPALLDNAIAAIVAQFARKNAANLFTGRGGKLLDATWPVSCLSQIIQNI